MATFAERLRILREEQGLSQRALADKVGVSNSAISVYERGVNTPRFETLDDLAAVLNVDYSYLLGESPIRGSYNRIPDEEVDTFFGGGPLELTVEERRLVEAYRRLDAYTRKLIRMQAHIEDGGDGA